jgi:hypothetical protein
MLGAMVAGVVSGERYRNWRMSRNGSDEIVKAIREEGRATRMIMHDHAEKLAVLVDRTK